MLGAYDDMAPLRIIGIDPGTDTLGVSVLEVCLATNRISLAMSATYSGTQMARNYRWISQVHGDKVARLRAHHDNLCNIFHFWNPHEIICEAPYLGRFPSAFQALVECKQAILSAVMDYDEYLQLQIVDPPTVKKALKVNGKSGDKSLMHNGITDLVNRGVIQNPSGIYIPELDEHSIDSIAVAYVRAHHVTVSNQYAQPA